MKKEDKNVAEVLVECLEAHGIKYIFGVPGEENLNFLEAVRKSKITFITTRHEQAAAFMAATFGRLTDKIGVALSTLGPGATNLLTGVAYAQLSGFPLLVITGQKPIKNNKQGKFQIVDIVSMMKPVTKFTTTIAESGNIANIVYEAISLAEAERPGAVHLELPEDISEEICNASSLTPSKITHPVENKKAITLALRDIEKSKRPLIVLGRGANKNFFRKPLEEFFNKTSIPFISTQMGKGAFDESLKLYIGTTALSDGDYVHKALHHADLVIMIGHDAIEKPSFIFNNKITKIIYINYFSFTFTNKININPDWDFSYFLKVRDMLKKDIAKFSDSTDFPLRPERIIGDIQKVLSKNDMLALDNGMYKIYFSRNFITKKPNGLLLDNTLATMGAGLPSGIALKIIYPKRKVLVVAGDGGIMMSIAELETAVRLKLNLVVLLLDDSGFGMIRWKQKDMNLASFGLSFNNPDFVMLAESFGAVGHKINKATDLLPTLKKALNSKGVHVIACPISYEEANKVLGTIKNI
ncbi:hypothetical protein A3A03_02330 [Candidatus Nomurabacteria bacterium RIFCSPLOWO2_01_FULL_40_18]|uniref:Acetolactate synthase n=1 Tax=Candidatus Nomurabacteria bacterium RIFCSPLOWO2_01_FULL_40_18 TaxID=1801773 RepID=A0A1F6XKD9_9BACT|nr:MAG: hypothetical protein A3A03_02330 [Candidatus Nomurabacteria bacterium RIFCSPLOWO2_01_FULL_40_18]